MSAQHPFKKGDQIDVWVYFLLWGLACDILLPFLGLARTCIGMLPFLGLVFRPPGAEYVDPKPLPHIFRCPSPSKAPARGASGVPEPRGASRSLKPLARRHEGISAQSIGHRHAAAGASRVFGRLFGSLSRKPPSTQRKQQFVKENGGQTSKVLGGDMCTLQEPTWIFAAYMVLWMHRDMHYQTRGTAQFSHVILSGSKYGYPTWRHVRSSFR